MTREEKNEYARRWRAANPERVESYRKVWAERNREHRKARMREWRAKNKERIAQYAKRYKQKHPDYYTEGDFYRHVFNRYGLTREQYDSMFEAQGGVCAICQRSQLRRTANRLDVDHDHETNKVRALLCMECNTGIGKFSDDPHRLRLAAAYLEKCLNS